MTRHHLKAAGDWGINKTALFINTQLYMIFQNWQRSTLEFSTITFNSIVIRAATRKYYGGAKIF